MTAAEDMLNQVILNNYQQEVLTKLTTKKKKKLYIRK